MTRERGKERRRGDIVAAAAALWRQKGPDAVTMSEIAEAAEVSTPTVYNLIGGIEALRIAVIEGVLSRLEESIESAEAIGVARSILRARTSADLFLSDEKLLRPLLVRVPRAVFEGASPARPGNDYQFSSICQAIAQGEIEEQTDVHALAQQVHLHFLGGLLAWACGTIDGETFVRSSEIAALAPLAACARPETRTRLQNRLRELLAPTHDADRRSVGHAAP